MADFFWIEEKKEIEFEQLQLELDPPLIEYEEEIEEEEKIAIIQL